MTGILQTTFSSAFYELKLSYFDKIVIEIFQYNKSALV